LPSAGRGDDRGVPHKSRRDADPTGAAPREPAITVNQVSSDIFSHNEANQSRTECFTR
jgi:hypothetical protein